MFKGAPDEAFDTARTAIEVGYRHLDGADVRETRLAGRCRARVRPAARGLLRHQQNQITGTDDPDDALTAFEQTPATLDIGYLDLFLIHRPLPKVGTSWTPARDGDDLTSRQVRAIGVSNFEPDHLQRVLDGADVVPAVNQVEIHHI